MANRASIETHQARSTAQTYLCVVVREILRADDAVHVGLHELLYDWDGGGMC